MIVKKPFLWSTSGYNSPDVVVSDSAIPVAAALCRASIGTPEWYGGGSNGLRIAKDQSFPFYWPQWEALHLPRCAYGFLKNGDKAANQAKFFVRCLNEAGGWKRGDLICLDVEEELNLSVHMILDWFSQVQALIPEVEPAKDFIIYSRANILNALSVSGLTAAQKMYLLSIPVWMAGYPDNPDGWTLDQLVHAYHVDTSKWGPTVIVQYAGSAVVQGLSKTGYLSIECNVAMPEFLDKWQSRTAAYYNDVPPVDPPVDPPVGGDMQAKYDVTVTSSTGISVRTQPNTNNTKICAIPYGTKFQASELVPDSDYPTDTTKLWAHVIGGVWDGKYIAVKYNGTWATYSEIVVTPPPPTSKKVVSALLTYDDQTTETLIPQ